MNLTNLQQAITQLRTNPDLLHKTRQTTSQQALCVHIGGDIWYPENNKSDSFTPHALNICHRCPTKNNCLTIALATQEKHGIWGAHTPTMRKQLQHQLNQQQSTP